MKHVKEIIAEAIFLISALASIFAVAMICFFLFANGLPAIFKIGPLKFLTGTIWKPGNDIYGIFPMILGKHLCNSGSDPDRRSHRNSAQRSIYPVSVREGSIM